MPWRRFTGRGRASGPRGLDDLVGEIVAKRHGDGQRLHLLRGHHPAEGHPAQVLQAGDATRTLPEVHAAVTRPATTRGGSAFKPTVNMANNERVSG